MADYLLGIDNGGTVSKVVIFDQRGREIQSASRKVSTHFPQPGWAERDMNAVWQSTADAIRDALAASGIAPQQIAVVGCTAHGNGIYLLDRQGKPLRPGILSVDSRAEALVGEWTLAGLPDHTWNSTFQKVWAAQPAALIAWFKRYEPELYAQIGTAFQCKDYIKYCLTGVLTAEFTDTSCTQLINLREKRYATEVLERLDIADAVRFLPTLVEPHTIIGQVTPEAAQATGLLAGTPVAGGMFDVTACALATGAIHPGQASIVVGTWSINSFIVNEPLDDRRLFSNTLYLPDRAIIIESSPTSASNLEWFVTEFCAAERQEAAQRGISVYDVCNEIVERTPSTPIIFHPYLFAGSAGFYGVGGWHNRAHLLRAVYEGIVYSHLSHIEKLRISAGQIDSARLTGGGARSRIWSQMFADALQIPMETVQGEEMGARGAAMCAGIGVGLYRDYDDAAAQVVQVERRYEPNPQAAAYYRERFEAYQSLGKVMGEMQSQLSKLQ